MANWTTLKATIADVIKTNGNQEITGAVLQNTLNSIVSAVGENATFAGIATPTTNPGTPDGPVFYIALELGVYSNFNGITLKNSGFAIIYNTDDNEWAFISYKELNLHSGIKETGTINGIGEDKIAFYWGNTYLKKGYKGRLQFTATGNVKAISCYITTNKGNLSGGYAAIIESYRNLSSNNEFIVDFIAQQDGYIMFNTAALSDISISCKIYTDLSSDVDKLSSDVDKLSSDVAELEDNSLTTKNKLFTFGGIANKQPDLGGLQTNWASVIHGVAAQEIETLFVIKSSNSAISSSLIFRLYKGNGATINTAFTELIDTITVTPDEFNQLKSGDIIKLPLSEKIDIGIEDYYTLELEIGTQAVHSLRFGACDAYAAHNLIREGFYKNTTDGNWIIVDTYPEGKYTYGLLWGIYIGEGSSVNFEQSWQEKFYMNILSSLQNYAERLSSDIDKLSSDVAELEDVVNIGLYTLTGNNEESASGPNRAFNFTDLELIEGNKYKFGIEYTNEEEINSISLYTDNVQGTNSYGYVEIGRFNKAKGLPLEIEFIPDVNGYLMFNIGATVNGSVSVTVKQAIQKSDIETDEIEVGTLTGNNDTDNYININFSWFKKKLYAGKKYQIRLVQNLISNTANTKFKTLSCYVTYTQGSLNGGYEAVFETKRSFDNNETIEYTPTKDGYLMLNTYASTDKTFYAYIYLKSIEDFTALQHDIYNLETRVAELEDNEKLSTIKQRAKTIIPNSVGKFPIIKPQFKDVYLTLCGDSIFAFQSTFTKDEKGVAAVPPTCDKKANANMLWNALGWGNPQYRRFDYGKKSLVGDWDNTWSDDSQAIFTEIGTFKTEYIGQTRREDPNFAGKIGTNVMQVSTKIDEASFPYQFDKSEDSWWQRNIPKRFSNSANASIKFTIPAGYSKFDFLYHAHIHGDSVTIAVDRGNGIVKVNTIPNDFSGEGAVEANNHVCDLSMENLTEVSGGNDSFGIPNMRLYFNITDTSLPTTITITKSSDTSKYLIYWGITYWGTSDLPYALHINNMAISGYTQQAIYNLRSAMFKFVPCDAIILEMCYNNLANKTFSGQIASMNTNMDNLKTYFESLGKNIGSDIGVWLPHCGQQGYRDYPDTVKCNYAGAEKLAIDKGYNVILNLDKICNDVHDTYYTDMNMPDFMNSLGNNGVHLDIQGQWIYSAAWESLT
jgi:outer membrane murein-binding lipoprotein Lpp